MPRSPGAWLYYVVLPDCEGACQRFWTFLTHSKPDLHDPAQMAKCLAELQDAHRQELREVTQVRTVGSPETVSSVLASLFGPH